MGFIETLTLLLGLLGFGLQPNPKPATPDQALHYAVPDADLVVHIDVASIVPGNYKTLLALPNQPQIRSAPELSKVLRKMVTEVEGMRGMGKNHTGIDFANDVTDATLFLRFDPRASEPAFLAVVRGKIPTTAIDSIARTAKQQAVKVGRGMMVDMGGGKPAVATIDGVLLAGTPDWVRARLADGWKAPARTPNSTLGYAQEAIAAKPVFAMIAALSPAARSAITGKFSGPNVVNDLVTRHRLVGLSLFHDGIGWTWIDRDKNGLDQVAQMSDGMLDLMRAAQIAPRGFAKIVLGALTSYRGTSKQVDELIARRGDVLKLVEAYSGDGSFKVAVHKDPKALRLDVRATGKSLSEVVPGFIGPAVLLGVFVSAGKKSAASVPPIMIPSP